MFRATFADHLKVKIALHSLWYHQTYRCDDTKTTTTNTYLLHGAESFLRS